MNALPWIDLALRYEEENRELRAALLALLFHYQEHLQLCTFANREIATRFPAEKAA